MTGQSVDSNTDDKQSDSPSLKEFKELERQERQAMVIDSDEWQRAAENRLNGAINAQNPYLAGHASNSSKSKEERKSGPINETAAKFSLVSGAFNDSSVHVANSEYPFRNSQLV